MRKIVLTMTLLMATAFFAACGGGAEYGKPVAAELSEDGATQRVTVTIDRGYYPNNIQARPGIPLEITFMRNEKQPSCAADVQVPAADFHQTVAEDGQVSVTIPPQPEGEIPFHCSMHHMKGRIVFSES